MQNLSVSPTKRHWVSQQGFSLIEVMIAMVILSVGILSIVAIQYLIVNGNTNGNVVTQQLNLAQRYMEQYKNRPTPADLEDLNLVNVDETGQAGGPYDVSVTVENLPAPSKNAAARFVTVTVRRNGGVGGHEIAIKSVTMGSGI